MQRTLSIVKPDGVSRGLIGEVVKRLEDNDLKIAAIKMIQKHLLRKSCSFSEAQKLQHLVLLTRQMNRFAFGIDRFRVEVHRNFACTNNRLRVPF